MDNINFTEFYDNQEDYSAFRNDLQKRKEYEIAVAWKVKNICSLVPGTLQFSNVLEVGCALGILLNKTADVLSIKNRIGLDISNENIKTAKQLFPDCTFVQGEIYPAGQMILKEEHLEKFDLIILSDIIEHIPDDRDFMNKISLMCSHVLLNLPLEKCYLHRKRKYGINDPSGHLRNYNSKDAYDLINSSGFTILKYNIANPHYFTDHLKIYKKNQEIRLLKKNIPKRIFWKGIFLIQALIRNLSPRFYMKLYGSNYFALLKSTK
jgi:predicted TPR repeat methyltransferase